MTKHKLISDRNSIAFSFLLDQLESEGWQAIPSTFKVNDRSYDILMFKVESNSPYRTETSHPSAPIPPFDPVTYPLKGMHEPTL